MKWFFIILLLLFLVGCNDQKRIPFPYGHKLIDAHQMKNEEGFYLCIKISTQTKRYAIVNRSFCFESKN